MKYERAEQAERTDVWERALKLDPDLRRQIDSRTNMGAKGDNCDGLDINTNLEQKA